MNQHTLSLALFAVGLAGVAFSLWKKFRENVSRSTHLPKMEKAVDYSQFGSDDPPPPGTIDFNKSIVDACGQRLTAEQKLAMLCKPAITRAEALTEARKILEQSLNPEKAQP